MTKEEFNSIEKLYHYTSFQSAFSILNSKSLLFGKLSQMNDINEAYRPCFYRLENYSEEDVQEILSSIRQISLTIDKEDRKGFAITPMWGHYANKDEGVCLVFDKNKLEEHLHDKEIKYKEISYCRGYDRSIEISGESVDSLFAKNSDNLFFTKSDAWQYEQEFRILAQDGRDKLNFGDSIIGIILYKAPDTDYLRDSEYTKSLQTIAPNIPILEFSDFRGEIQLIDNNSNDWLADTNFEIDI